MEAAVEPGADLRLWVEAKWGQRTDMVPISGSTTGSDVPSPRYKYLAWVILHGLYIDALSSHHQGTQQKMDYM